MTPWNSLSVDVFQSFIRSTRWMVSKGRCQAEKPSPSRSKPLRSMSQMVLFWWSGEITTYPWDASLAVKNTLWYRMAKAPWEKITRG